MFHSTPKWPALFWNTISVVSADTRYGKWQMIYSVLLSVSCVYNFFVTPQIVCSLEDNCDGSLSVVIKGMFMRVVASTCLVSRVAIMLKGRSRLVQCRRNVDKFHVFAPITRSDAAVSSTLACRLVASCLLLTVPVNFLSVWVLLHRTADSTLSCFVLMYVQNTSMYCVETHFTSMCFDLYRKFVGINRDLMALKVSTISRNKYPFVTRTGQTERGDRWNLTAAAVGCNRDVVRGLAAGHPMADYAEQLKIKHRLLRDAVKNLNDLFGIHLGLSLCSLCLCAMFELYYYVVGITSFPEYNALVCGSILQYTIRFVSVTTIAHLTPKQALKSKLLITDINNRHLDKITKEELQLFINQISGCSIEFTACDFFTLNTHLIISAFAAGTTYLVILLQFNLSKT